MTKPKLLTDDQVREFITNGFLVLEPDVDAALHASIDEQVRCALEHDLWYGNNITARVPRIADIVRSPVVDGAVRSLAGPDYAFHPHRAIHHSTPVEDKSVVLTPEVEAPKLGKGSIAGSAWHQDAQSPLSRARHHVPRYLIGFYFPHDTPAAMGPTRIQAGTHLFANPADPIDVVLPEHVRAGTFMLVHFDMVHSGFPNRSDLDRNMVKLVFSRTRFPKSASWDHHDADWQRPTQCIPSYDLPEAWSYLWNWMRGVPSGALIASDEQLLHPHPQVARLQSLYRRAVDPDIDQLVDEVRAAAGQRKHERCLAIDKDGHTMPKDDIRGYPRCWNERAVVMEDATYTLTACGEAAMAGLTDLLTHDDPWV